MDTSVDSDRPDAMVARLSQATNDHDLEAVVDCFTEDYRNETPAHPSRGFRGRDQVRKNWQQILAAVPDLRASVLRCAVDGDAVWSEWEMRGTRLDGSVHLMRGVIIFGTRARRASWARFYMEPAQDSGEDVNEAVRRAVSPGAAAS
jgi:ketosteroid isomerase-like protein